MTTRVLLVDDDQGDFEMTRAMLSQAEHGNFSLEWVSTFEEALDAFDSGNFDVFLVDYFLEDRTGLDLLGEARSRGLRQPIIMLTGRGSHRVDEEAMAAGAADYLVKGRIDPELLERSIRYAMDRRHSALALQDSEERHRSMFDHLPVGVYRRSPDGSLTDANPALARIMGAPDRESLMTKLSDTLFVSADDQERFWNLLVRDGVVRGFESSIQRLDGTELRVRTTARIFSGPEGEVLYVEGTVEDITNEIRVQELSGSEARFRAVFQDSQSGIAILDLSGLIREANPAFNRFFGHKGREMVGTAFPDLLTEEDRPAAIREIEALAGGNQETVRAQRRFVTPSEREEWAGSSLSLIRKTGGDPEDILVILTSLAPG